MARQTAVDQEAFRQGMIDGLTLAPLRHAFSRIVKSLLKQAANRDVSHPTVIYAMKNHDREQTASRETTKLRSGNKV